MIGRKKEKGEKLKKEKVGFFKKLKNSLLKIFYRLSNSMLGAKIKRIFEWVLREIEKSIRFELMVVFALCFIVSFLFYGFANNVLAKNRTVTSIEYNLDSIQAKAYNIAKELSYRDEYYEDITDDKLIDGIEDEDSINNILNQYNNEAKIYLTDLDGKILYDVNGDAKDRLDIFTILDKINNTQEEGSERTYLYPVNVNGDRAYLIYYETPTPYISYDNYIDENSFLALSLSVVVFISIFIIITNKKMKYIDDIASGVRIISSGDLSYRVEEKGKDEIKNLAENINYMASEIQNRIELERRAEKTKNELITNVSHDLRTPLTSILGYLRILDQSGLDQEDKEALEIKTSSK